MELRKKNYLSNFLTGSRRNFTLICQGKSQRTFQKCTGIISEVKSNWIPNEIAKGMTRRIIVNKPVKFLKQFLINFLKRISKEFPKIVEFNLYWIGDQISRGMTEIITEKHFLQDSEETPILPKKLPNICRRKSQTNIRIQVNFNWKVTKKFPKT